eukprot:CAMPEP_0177602256 /NCGR_PEP_ID=MMETSP0419_2-20121207/14756_1 /TAXON_ID=582737 /ORGANISM="Tetraselmis sp., Strain GSL018" /LENGTH=480 /DNA_ID=CAMNT_0019095697 /DNA_START=251 /DNA_END=1691 /DNA_ORIENTATION=-
MTEPKKHGNKAPLWQDLLMLGVSVLASGAVMSFVLKQIDPQRDAKLAAKKRKQALQKRLGMQIEMNEYEQLLAADVVNPDCIDVTLYDIGGLDPIIDSLYNKIISPMQQPQLFLSSPLLKPSKGILLYGPPGTGKTMLAKAIAKESGANFINLRVSSLHSKWFGDSTKLVTAAFTLAWKLQPSIIFVDEVDALLGKRNSMDQDIVTSVKTEFMQLWDGMVTDSDANVIVLAATNRPYDLDEAVLRRLPLSFEVGMPSAAQRESILRVILSNEAAARGSACIEPALLENTPEETGPAAMRPLERIAEATEGFSGSDLMELCKQAACRPLHEFISSMSEGKKDAPEAPRPLTVHDLEASIATSRPSRFNAQKYYMEAAEAASHQTGLSPMHAIAPAEQPAGSGEAVTQLLSLMKFLAQMQHQAPANGNGTPNGDIERAERAYVRVGTLRVNRTLFARAAPATGGEERGRGNCCGCLHVKLPG